MNDYIKYLTLVKYFLRKGKIPNDEYFDLEAIHKAMR